MGFEIVDVSGDIGIRASGNSLEDVFINAAEALYSLITNIDRVKPEKSLSIEVKGHNIESLIVSFLNELIFHFDAYGFIGRSIDIKSNIKDLNTPEEEQELWLRAVIRGEDFDPERHERRLLVKAATYHNLRFYKEDNLWKVEIIFDI